MSIAVLSDVGGGGFCFNDFKSGGSILLTATHKNLMIGLMFLISLFKAGKIMCKQLWFKSFPECDLGMMRTA